MLLLTMQHLRVTRSDHIAYYRSAFPLHISHTGLTGTEIVPRGAREAKIEWRRGVEKDRKVEVEHSRET